MKMKRTISKRGSAKKNWIIAVNKSILEQGCWDEKTANEKLKEWEWYCFEQGLPNPVLDELID